jgi:hypothetical protein
MCRSKIVAIQARGSDSHSSRVVWRGLVSVEQSRHFRGDTCFAHGGVDHARSALGDPDRQLATRVPARRH